MLSLLCEIGDILCELNTTWDNILLSKGVATLQKKRGTVILMVFATREKKSHSNTVVI